MIQISGTTCGAVPGNCREKLLGKGIMIKFYIGDIVKMRKVHPCGGTDWEIMRVGMDFRIKCTKCNRVVMLPRPKFEKAVKSIVKTSSPPTLISENSDQKPLE